MKRAYLEKLSWFSLIHTTEEYKIIVNLITNNGKFDIPKTWGLLFTVKYWRLKKDLPLDYNGGILFQQRNVLKKGELKSVVNKVFKKNKSGGYKKLRTKAADADLSKK